MIENDGRSSEYHRNESMIPGSTSQRINQMKSADPFSIRTRHQFGIPWMLRQALSDHRPKGVADQRADARRLGGALADVDLADDGREPAALQRCGEWR